ncbi:InlB B-repeat-containing protein, partial [Flavonifractor sp. An92]|uniref:InlB B-repeat-containing protein n=1 Tax=Flavonifractor sp. An92 TaxID=1965666 RepID=UPI0019D12AF6
MLMAMVMCLGLVSTSALADVNDTEFHIMELDTVKAYLANGTGAGAEDIKIQSIYVSDNSGETATGPAANHWDSYHGVPYWYVLNTVSIIDTDDISGITVNYCVNGESYSTAIPASMLTVNHLSGADWYITEIYLNYTEPEPEPELQTVYVYAQAKAGQGTVNDSGYFTIGTIQLPLEEATWNDTEDGEGRYAEYENAIANALKNLNKGGYNDWIDPDDVDWYSLKAADGADNYVSSGTMTWHLDGKIKDEVQLYYVTYDLNNGEGTVPTDPKGYAAGQEFKVADGTGLTKDGYEFAGWSTDKKATKPDETFAIPAEGGNVTLYAVWTPKAEPQEGMLRVTKVMELPKGMKLPEDYQVTLKVTEDGTKIGEKTFGYYQLVNGSASFDIY